MRFSFCVSDSETFTSTLKHAVYKRGVYGLTPKTSQIFWYRYFHLTIQKSTIDSGVILSGRRHFWFHVFFVKLAEIGWRKSVQIYLFVSGKCTEYNKSEDHQCIIKFYRLVLLKWLCSLVFVYKNQNAKNKIQINSEFWSIIILVNKKSISSPPMPPMNS